MTILILHGPNLNLLGLKSSKLGEKLTLDKVNRAIRLHVRNKDIKLKIIQTHKEYIAINFIQRNRNSATGLVVIPTSWAKYNQTLLETIKICSLPTAAVYFMVNTISEQVKKILLYLEIILNHLPESQ